MQPSGNKRLKGASSGVQQKKKVRRRMHVSRPYQEGILNMAEARREIAEALKTHRAAMKQAADNTLLQQQRTQGSSLSQEKLFHSFVDAGEDTSIVGASSPGRLAFPPLNTSDAMNLPLPKKPLGLSLNIHFSGKNPSPSLSPTSSSSCGRQKEDVASSSGEKDKCSEWVVEEEEGVGSSVGEDEMKVMMSIGEQHQLEWDDAMSLVRSAWWWGLLQKMEAGEEGR